MEDKQILFGSISTNRGDKFIVKSSELLNDVRSKNIVPNNTPINNDMLVKHAWANAQIAGYNMSLERAHELFSNPCSLNFAAVRGECFVTGVLDAFRYLKTKDWTITTAGDLRSLYHIMSAGCSGDNFDIEGNLYRVGNLENPIRGVDYNDIEFLMTQWIAEYNCECKTPGDVIINAAYLSAVFTRIAPFADANARIARILMLSYLAKHGYFNIVNSDIFTMLFEDNNNYIKTMCCTVSDIYDCTSYVELLVSTIIKALNA